jgi:hypothetical protein
LDEAIHADGGNGTRGRNDQSDEAEFPQLPEQVVDVKNIPATVGGYYLLETFHSFIMGFTR